MLESFFKVLVPSLSNKFKLLKMGIKTPMLSWSGVKVLVDTSDRTEFLVPLSWRTRNSWGTLFFAAIASGVDVCGAWSALRIAEQNCVGVLYKEMNIKFLRRVDEDLRLVCTDVSIIQACALQAAQSGERVNVSIKVQGYCDSYSSQQPVVSADLQLSMKKR